MHILPAAIAVSILLVVPVVAGPQSSGRIPRPTKAEIAAMARYREEMKKYYYDASKYPTYLEQLGIACPTVKTVP
jgi:hypothetical protein